MRRTLLGSLVGMTLALALSHLVLAKPAPPRPRPPASVGTLDLQPVNVQPANVQPANVQPAQLLVSSTQGTLRGCRDGGPGNINRAKPQWVSVQPGDAPQVAEGLVTASKVSSSDNPANHTSHDQNFDLHLDVGYQFLHSDANPVEDGARVMEMEWESRYFPPQFWPVDGDRAWMLGRWIFDCGHPPYRTEIHPPRAVAFTRLEPTLFPGSSMPAYTNRAYVYVHGRAGYYKTPVATRNYEFDVPLPPKPFADTPVRSNRLRAEVLELPFGGPRPILTPQPTVNPTRVHVVYPLNLGNPDPNLRYGAVLAVGWQEQSILAVQNPGPTRFRQLRVTFDSIRINNDHDPVFSGEWNLWVRAGGSWFQLSGLGDVDNGQTVNINKTLTLIVPENGSWSVETTGWEDDCDDRFRSSDAQAERGDLSAADLQCELDGNDNIGIVSNIATPYTAADNFGVGQHNSPSRRNGDADTLNDFNLRFHVEEVARFPRPGSGPAVK